MGTSQQSNPSDAISLFEVADWLKTQSESGNSDYVMLIKRLSAALVAGNVRAADAVFAEIAKAMESAA